MIIPSRDGIKFIFIALCIVNVFNGSLNPNMDKINRYLNVVNVNENILCKIQNLTVVYPINL